MYAFHILLVFLIFHTFAVIGVLLVSDKNIDENNMSLFEIIDVLNETLDHRITKAYYYYYTNITSKPLRSLVDMISSGKSMDLHDTTKENLQVNRNYTEYIINNIISTNQITGNGAIITREMCNKHTTIYVIELKTERVNCTPLIINEVYFDYLLTGLSKYTYVFLIITIDEIETFLDKVIHIKELHPITFVVINISKNIFNKLEITYSQLELKYSNSTVVHDALQETVRINEYSRINRNDTNTMRAPQGKEKFHISSKTLDKHHFQLLPKDRYNMKKRVIKAVTVPAFPYVFESIGHYNAEKCSKGHICSIPIVNGTEIVIEWRWSCCVGLSIDLFDLVANELNFEYELYFTPDDKFGTIDNGSWNGIVKEIRDERAEFAVQAIRLSNLRSTAVDFSAGYVTSKISILLRKDFETHNIINWNFASFIELSLAIAILVATVTTISCIWLFENIGFFFKLRDHFASREVMTYIFGLAFQRDMGGRNPSKWSGRFVALGYAAAMTVIMSTYTANITANSINDNDKYKALSIFDPKFTNPTPDFRFSIVGNKGWFIEDFFKHHRNSKFRNMYKFMRKYFVNSDEEGVKAVLHRRSEAHIGEALEIQSALNKHLTQNECNKLYMIQPDFGISMETLAFAYSKNSTLGKQVSHHIIKLRGYGVLEDLRKKWLYKSTCVIDFTSKLQRFDWTYFGGILLIMVCTVAIGIVLVFLENAFTCFRRRHKERNLRNVDNANTRRSRDLFTATRALQLKLEDGFDTEDVVQDNVIAIGIDIIPCEEMT